MITTKKIHELIDREDPHCLYCNNKCNVALEGNFIPKSPLIYDTETLTCQECGERFSINSIQKSDGETIYMGFAFSCSKYNIFCSYEEEYYEIQTRSGKYIISLPPFEIEFSDKQKLFDKIKTYIIFS